MYKTFSGTNSQYVMLHRWVESKMGKPMWCWKCKVRGLSRYHWANRSGEYRKDIFDWDRLCVSCHWKQDGTAPYAAWKVKGNAKACKNGHKYTVKSTYWSSKGSRVCRECHKNTQKKYIKRELRKRAV